MWTRGTVAGLGCLVLLVLLLFAPLSAGQTQADALSGEELYVDRLGCWNCHGDTGGGGAGPAIAKTELSLRTFATYLRLPSGEMPRVSPRLASDADLAMLYRWLDGIEAPSAPLPLRLSLEESVAAGAGLGEVTLTAQVAETSPHAELPDAAMLRYRVTLQTLVPWVREKTLVANQTVEYQPTGREDWSTFTTDERGEAVLGADQGFVLPDVRASEPATVRLRTELASGRHALVVEAIDGTDPAAPVVVGLGTVVLRVE
jgi:mono/diheme cytochrome c family protein